MHQIQTGRAPQYLAHSVQSVAESSRRPGLRSADTADYIKRLTRTKFGKRCFSHAGLAAWNSLPDSIAYQLTPIDLMSFKNSSLSPRVLTFVSAHGHFICICIVQYLVEKFILSVVHHLGNVGVISCTEAALRAARLTKPVIRLRSVNVEIGEALQAGAAYSNLLI